MERKKFYDQIDEDTIRSIQELEDDDSERYDCLYDYILNHEDIISQYSTFDFSNERCFDKSALDRVHVTKIMGQKYLFLIMNELFPFEKILIFSGKKPFVWLFCLLIWNFLFYP